VGSDVGAREGATEGFIVGLVGDGVGLPGK